MKKLGEIISEELFLNAFLICRSYCQEEHILDVNFRLLKGHFLSLSETRVRNFYKKYVSNDLVYSIPELFSSDVVSIPKRLTGVREYRFFSCFSMILYNAVGLLFADCCSQFIDQLDFARKNVFAFYPTKFIRVNDKWKARNDYKDEYRKFTDRLNQQVQQGDIVLKLDIAAYFESISHEKLVGLLLKLSPESVLEKHNYSAECTAILEFYLESLMSRRFGIPQGRRNFVSDYFGYIYLIPFDIEIPALACSGDLTFKGLVRYVDDIHVILKANGSISRRDIFRELLTIEQAISSWLYNKWNLNLNSEKIVREIIRTKKKKEKFIIFSKKAISSPPDSPEKTGNEEKQGDIEELRKRFKAFRSALGKFRYTETDAFELAVEDEDKEALKSIFDRAMQRFVFNQENLIELKKTLSEIDLELTADHINILITVFFLKNRNARPFLQPLESFLFKSLNLTDKRHIHICLNALAQNIKSKRLYSIVRKNRAKLIEDNYSKYLLPFFRIPYLIKANAIYQRIYREHLKQKTKRGTFLYDGASVYQKVVEYIVKHVPNQQTLIQPLKNYVNECAQKRWDIAFNHFHSLFHELCKLKFKLSDSCTVKEVVRKLHNIGLEDELLIMKFYDRRNFNPISHPSQKGKPSVKVSEADLNDYEKKILCVIEKHLI